MKAANGLWVSANYVCRLNHPNLRRFLPSFCKNYQLFEFSPPRPPASIKKINFFCPSISKTVTLYTVFIFFINFNAQYKQRTTYKQWKWRSFKGKGANQSQPPNHPQPVVVAKKPHIITVNCTFNGRRMDRWSQQSPLPPSWLNRLVTPGEYKKNGERWSQTEGIRLSLWADVATS